MPDPHKRKALERFQRPYPPMIPATDQDLGLITDRLDTLETDVGTAETDIATLQAGLAALPQGVLGHVEVTSSQSGITTEADLTGLSVTIQPAAGRLIRVHGEAQTQGTGTGVTTGSIYEDATVISRFVRNGAALHRTNGSRVIETDGDSHTYKMTLQTTATSVDMQASATTPAFLLIEDLGAAP